MEWMKDLEAKLEVRRPKDGVGCILCAWILEDLRKNKTLTTKVPDPCTDGSPAFPLEGKVKHLMLEGFWQAEMKGLVPEAVLKKLSFN